MPVVLEWEPADPIYGADADGHRGMYLPGYWSAVDVPRCPNGCELEEGEQKDVQAAVRDCEKNVPDPDDEYWGPDSSDEDC